MGIRRWLKPTSTGIDLGGRWIKAVELYSDGSVARSARLPRKPGAQDQDEASRLCELLRRQGFQLRTATILTGNGALRRQVIGLPEKADPVRDDAIIQNQLGDLQSEHGRRGAIGWWELPRSCRPSDGREALAVETDHASTASWLHGFDSQGVRVQGVDTHSSVFSRVAADQNCVIADLGWSGVGLTLVVGGLPVYERSDPASGLGSLIEAESTRTQRVTTQVEALLRSDASELGVLHLPGALSWARVIGESVTATADYGVRRYGLEGPLRVWLTGGGATPEVIETLGTLLGSDSVVGACGVDVDLIGAWAAARRWAA